MELELILTELQPFELSHFRQLFALYGMEFPLTVFNDHFEPLHTCCGCIEDVHVNFADEKIIFDKITAFWT